MVCGVVRVRNVRASMLPPNANGETEHHARPRQLSNITAIIQSTQTADYTIIAMAGQVRPYQKRLETPNNRCGNALAGSEALVACIVSLLWPFRLSSPRCRRV